MLLQNDGSAEARPGALSIHAPLHPVFSIAGEIGY